MASLRIRIFLGAAVASLTAIVAPALSAGVPVSADTCVVSDKLVNSCRPWLGAVVGNYPNLPTWKDQVLGHERRIGRQVDMVHQYHAVGNDTLSGDEVYFVNRGTILYINWKPTNLWRDGTGGNATVNARIDTMARSIKAVAPYKVMVALWGEPERYVSVGTSSCPELRGSMGSPAEYRAMWHNVRARFDALGATNVVWAINYLGYVRWDCLFPELWPGNDYVDWILWDPYVGPNERWDVLTGHFYDVLLAKSDATHDYTSKPWGLAEFGYWYGNNQSEAYRMYDEAKASLDAGRYPRLKLYEPFDIISSNGTDTRVSYTARGVFDQVEQDHYNALANDPAFSSGTPPPPPSTVDYFATCDKSVESGLSCFAGTYSTPIYPTWYTGDGYTGSHSVQVLNSTASAGTYGLNARPAPVSSTVIGRTYQGGAWVKASQPAMNLTLLLRERRPANGTAPAGGYTAVTWTSTDTQWHLISAAYTAKEAGNTITFSVYAAGMPAGSWLRADEFTLASGG